MCATESQLTLAAQSGERYGPLCWRQATGGAAFGALSSRQARHPVPPCADATPHKLTQAENLRSAQKQGARILTDPVRSDFGLHAPPPAAPPCNKGRLGGGAFPEEG